MSKEFIESDALKANLQETAVKDVPIDPSYAVLVEIVADYRGIHNSINDLLFEINHPFRNWSMVLPKLRAFILKHTNH